MSNNLYFRRSDCTRCVEFHYGDATGGDIISAVTTLDQISRVYTFTNIRLKTRVSEVVYVFAFRERLH